MRNYAKKLIESRKIVLFLCAVIIAVGFAAYYFIPKSENPDTSVPFAVISTIYPGASASEVEESVTNELEEAIQEIENIVKVESKSRESLSTMVVEFESDVDWDNAKSVLVDTIIQAQDRLPESCLASDINTNLTETADFIITVSSDAFSAEDLEAYAQNIKTSLATIDGISKINVEGERDKQIDVVLNIEALEAYNLTSTDIAELISAQNVNVPSGDIKYDGEKIAVSADTEFGSVQDIENIIVASESEGVGMLRLSDVADVRVNYGDSYSYMQDDDTAILICGYFKQDKNAILIGKEVRGKIDEIKASMPEDILFHEAIFSPEGVSKSINSFMVSLLQSIALIILVVMIGVKLKNGLIISIVLPFSILCTFIAMHLFKIEFQFISIAALIISLGILVDNAVVVSHSIQSKLDVGKEKKEAISLAIKETAVPILTSSVTTVITFGTLYFNKGSIGSIVKTIPTIVIVALVASYVAAMVLIPVLAYLFFTPAKKAEDTRKAKKEKGVVKSIFMKALGFGLNHKIITFVGSFATLGVAILLFMQLGLSFFPYSDKSVIYINATTQSMNLGKTEKVAHEIGEILDDHPAVLNYTTAVGKALPKFFLTLPIYPAADNFTQIMVELDLESSEAYSNSQKVGSELQKAFDESIVEAYVEVKYLEYAVPTDAKIEILLSGDDLGELSQTAENVSEALGEIEGAFNIRDDRTDGTKKYIVDMDDNALDRYGVLKYDVARQLNVALMGTKATTYTVGKDDMDIIVSTNADTLSKLVRLPITSSITGEQVSLSQLAEVKLGSLTPAIMHYDNQRSYTVLCDVLEGHSSFDILNEFKEKYESEAIPSSVRITYLGEADNMNDLLSDVWLYGGGALLLVFIVLLIQFKSFKRSMIILGAIPLSLIGCFFGLYIAGVDFQAMAILGIVALFGIVVNNGILLIEFIDKALEGGMSIKDACLQSVSERYQPIMISAVTTCVGLVPLMLSGDPMTAPMALVLFFGLMFSTVLTMVALPTMYSLFIKNKKLSKNPN